MQTVLLHALAKNWWMLLVRGLAAIAFGAMAMAWPKLTLVTLILLYAAFVLVDGILAVAAAVVGPKIAPRWWLALIGLIGIGFGIATFSWPGLTALVLIWMIGAWSVAHGVIEIIAAIQLRKEIDNEWWLIAAGVISVLFGLAVLARPGAGALAMVFVIGAYAIAYGVMLVFFSLRLKKHAAASVSAPA